MPNRLSPSWIFTDEMTRINDLYWKTSYTYARMPPLLRAMSESITDETNPFVSAIWPAKSDGERRQTTVRLTEFSRTLSSNLETLRSTSLLYLCSAFENALSGYYVLCALYQPNAVDPAWRWGAVPALLGRAPRYKALKDKAFELAGASVEKNRLRGPYSRRLDHLDRTFALGLPALPTAALDRSYQLRHRVAHDQGLSQADDPDSSPHEVLSARVSLTEPEWKAVSKEFDDTVAVLDARVQAVVVKDLGVPIAANHILNRDGPLTIGHLRHRINFERHLDVTHSTVESACLAIGRTVSPGGKLFRRVVT